MRLQRQQPRSEPRVTRDMLRSQRYSSLSCPTTPSNVIADKTQNLERVLQVRNPIVSEAVISNSVQVLDRALDNSDMDIVGDNRRRQSRRTRHQKVDYLHLHKYGRRQ